MSSSILNEYGSLESLTNEGPTIPLGRPHRALQVIDVIDEILSKLVEDNDSIQIEADQLDGNDNRRSQNANLLSVALCCKTFTAPSLDHLWKRMDTIIPLLRLLPGTMWVGGSIFITGAVNPQSLPRRVYEYAERILNLTYMINGDFGAVHPLSWLRLSTLEGGLLPRLRSFRLSYNCATASGMEKSLLLLPTILQSPHLTSVAVDMPKATSSESHGLGPVLAILSDLNFGITDLSLSGPYFYGYTDRLLNIKTLKSVTLKLSSGGPTTDIFTSLSCLPSLTELLLDFTNSHSVVFSGFVGAHSFLNLVKLTLKGSSLLECTLPSITALKLKYITIRCTPDWVFSRTPTRAQLLLSAYPELRNVIIDWGGHPQSRAGKSSVTNFTWNARRLAHMETFILTSLDPNICVTGAEIIAMAEAWPQLKVLRIEHTAKPAHEPTLASLEYLANGCPHLTEISITVKEMFPQKKSTEPVSFHCLQRLDLQHTTIADHARMARYLDGWFPYLLHFALLSESDCTLVRAIIFNACQPVRSDQQKRDRVRDTIMIRKVVT